MMLELTANNFRQEILESEQPCLVDFWAEWCMPCKMIAPIVGELSREYEGQCKVAKLNVDNAMEIATKFSVMNIPTLIFFKNGKEYSRIVGVVSKDNIKERIEQMLV